MYNEIDHSLSESAVKAVYPSASHNTEGVEFTDIGRTEWGAKVVPSSRGRRSWTRCRAASSATPASTPGRTAPATPTAGAGPGRGVPPRRAEHRGGGHPLRRARGHLHRRAGVNTSSSHGAESGSNQAVKGYQESDKLRQGPVYLIEYDATWAFGAGSKLKTPAAFHPNDPSLPSTPLHKRPTRWGVDDVTVRMAGWYSESDAIALGFLTPDQAKDMAPVMDRLNNARKEFSEAEAAYADTRAPLEGLAEGYAAAPGDRSAEDAYNAQEDKYKEALSDFNDQIDALIETVNNTRTTLEEAGQGTDSGTAPPCARWAATEARGRPAHRPPPTTPRTPAPPRTPGTRQPRPPGHRCRHHDHRGTPADRHGDPAGPGAHGPERGPGRPLPVGAEPPCAGVGHPRAGLRRLPKPRGRPGAEHRHRGRAGPARLRHSGHRGPGGPGRTRCRE
ncbi:hypothetical protein HFP72_27415 [Nocardiopsis sp. ARC36]